MDIDAYLARIDYHGPRDPSPATLRGLHRAHLYTVPFENLDIHAGRPIRLEPEALFDKIVVRRRGGFCYELNGLFALLLEALGFAVTRLSASDIHSDGSPGPEFDHLALQVRAPTAPAIPWLADVGWGDSFIEPLRLDRPGEPQPEGLRAYCLERDPAETWLLWQRRYDGQWERQYRFTLQPRRLADFAAMCVYHQTDPASSFTRRTIVTRAAPAGRVSLEAGRLIVTQHGQRSETPIEGEDEYRRLLHAHFNLQ